MLQNLGTHRIPIGPDISGKKNILSEAFNYIVSDKPIYP